MRPPVVSVLTPTRASTRHLLPRVLRCLQQQTVGGWEWVILDDSPEPMKEALSWPSTRYIHRPEPRPLGEKRNLLVAVAGAPICAHFDDDDLYGPRYLEAMLAQFVNPSVKVAKLSSWYLALEKNPHVYHWDTRLSSPRSLYLLKASGPLRAVLDAETVSRLQSSAQVGFGWSYVFDQEYAESRPFLARDWDEDSVLGASAQVDGALALVEDDAGDPLEALAVHLVTETSTSRSFATRQVEDDEVTRRLSWALQEMG